MAWMTYAGSLLAGFALTAPPTDLPIRTDDLSPPVPIKPARPRTPAEVARDQAQVLYGTALLKQRGGDPVAAARLLEEAIRLDPKAPAPRRALLPVYDILGRVEEVLEGCRVIVETDPGDAETWHFYARYLREQARPAEAITALNDGLRQGDAERLKPGLRTRMLMELAALREETSAPAADRIAAYHDLLAMLTKHRNELIELRHFSSPALANQAIDCACRLARMHLDAKQPKQADMALKQARPLAAAEASLRGSFAVGQLDWLSCRTAQSLGQAAEALGHVERYLALRPRHPEAYETRYDLLTDLGRGREVLAAVRADAGRDPAYLPLQLLLAKELGRRPSTRPEAEALYRTLSRTHAERDLYRGWFALHREQGRLRGILSMIDGVLATVGNKETPDGEKAAAADRGNAMLAALRAEPTLLGELLPLTLEDRPADDRFQYETMRLMAGLALRAGRYDTAQRLFRDCLTAPGEIRWKAAEGLIAAETMARRWADLAKTCEEMLSDRRDLNRFFYLAHLATAQAELGRSEDAIATVDEAIRFAVDQETRGRMRRHKVRVLRLVGQYREAVAESESLLKDFPLPDDIRQTRYALSHVYSTMRDHRKAEEQLRLLLADQPDDAGACNDLGYQLADQNRELDEAEKLVRRALDLDRQKRQQEPDLEPENAAYLDSLGWVLFRRGRHQEALEWLERSAAMPEGANDPTVWDHVGDVRLRLGDQAGAAAAWETAWKCYAHDVVGRRDGRADEVKRKLRLVRPQ